MGKYRLLFVGEGLDPPGNFVKQNYIAKVVLAVFDRMCYNKLNYADNRINRLPWLIL